MILNDKYFLDFEGLSSYDELIKKYIENNSDEATKDIIESLAQLTENVEQNTKDIEVLNGDDTVEGSVANQVKVAVDNLVDGAPELLDTLKEIADWIGEDETGTTKLINRVAKNEDDIADLQENVEDVYDAIKAIPRVKIASLFPAKQDENQTAKEAIEAMNENAAIELVADQTIAEDIVITKACYIDANGSTFEGTVTVPSDAEVVIENATFSKPLVVA